MSDFCYKCGVASHVTGRCTLGDPATITSANGITTKLYGPWTRSAHSGSLSFVNPQPSLSWILALTIYGETIPGVSKEDDGPRLEVGALIKNLQAYFLERKRAVLKSSNKTT